MTDAWSTLIFWKPSDPPEPTHKETAQAFSVRPPTLLKAGPVKRVTHAGSKPTKNKTMQYRQKRMHKENQSIKSHKLELQRQSKHKIL